MHHHTHTDCAWGLGDIAIDWTLSGFKGWTEIQIGRQIEVSQLPMPGIPTDFLTFSRWTLIASFIFPWVVWWIFLPQELIWRGWVVEGNDTVRSWMVLSLYWTAWQLPLWLTEPDWHWGWWLPPIENWPEHWYEDSDDSSTSIGSDGSPSESI